ncbi:MAG: DUF1801 domain-containing protein [Deltaproteobacteria bacterium]|nr:DUF1801 domain-containing protein [Deltaproteobacteria bacterium]
MAVPSIDAARVRAYFAALPPLARRRAKSLRSLVRAAAPDAIEVFSYGIPGLRWSDRALLWYAGWAEHAALYPITHGVRRALGPALAKHALSKGTVRFAHDRPLPSALVRRIVHARIAEIRSARSARRVRKSKTRGGSR